MQRFLILFLLVAALAPRGVRGQAAPSLAPAKVAAVDAAVEAERVRQRVVGVAVGIVQDNEIVYLHGYGFANAEKKEPVTVHTMFRWASISKTLTAVAAMQLAQSKALDLDADVREYVPEFPDKGVKITARQLLCHQSGIPHYTNGKIIVTHVDYKAEHPFVNLVTALDRFKESPLLFTPGDRFSYSTYGFMLLGAVVQRAGKEPYPKQVRDRILQPLGMSSVMPDYQWENIPDRATGYVLEGNEVKPSTDTDVSWKLAGGGFISDIGGLARWAKGLLERRLLEPASYETMWEIQHDDNGRATNWGLGFEVQGSGPGLKVSHNGLQEKASCRMVLYPGGRNAVVVMTNSYFADPGKFSTAIYKALGSKTPPAEDSAKPKE